MSGAFFILNKEAEAIAPHQKDHHLIKYQQVIEQCLLVGSGEEQAYNHEEV